MNYRKIHNYTITHFCEYLSLNIYIYIYNYIYIYLFIYIILPWASNPKNNNLITLEGNIL